MMARNDHLCAVNAVSLASLKYLIQGSSSPSEAVVHHSLKHIRKILEEDTSNDDRIKHLLLLLPKREETDEPSLNFLRGGQGLTAF